MSHTAVRLGQIRPHTGTIRHLVTAAQSCGAPVQQQLTDRQHSHHQTSSSHTLLETPVSAYVHLPFCKRRCFYCDFPVSVVGSKPEQPGIQQGMQEYVDLLCQEIKATVQLPGPPLQTVFFGGGTPTLVPPAMLEQILQAIEQRYGISPTAEVSMESDPGTFDTPRLQQYMSLGVNRFSMGVQCFQQNLLELCGRSHTLSDVYKAIDSMHSAGIANWSLDLISGLPQLTSKDWQHSLQEAVAASPTHISVYDLQVNFVLLTAAYACTCYCCLLASECKLGILLSCLCAKFALATLALRRPSLVTAMVTPQCCSSQLLLATC